MRGNGPRDFRVLRGNFHSRIGDHAAALTGRFQGVLDRLGKEGENGVFRRIGGFEVCEPFAHSGLGIAS